MGADGFTAGWRQEFGDVAPFGHLCRTAVPARWLRIHSLPESRRYPENEADFAELLRRHDTVASTLLGSSDECVLYVASYDEDLPAIDGVTLTPLPELAVFEPADPEFGVDEPSRIYAGAARVVWSMDRFEPLIRAVAETRADGGVFVNFQRHTAYAPYDGGADVFLDTPRSVSRMKKQWRPWLSAHPSGL